VRSRSRALQLRVINRMPLKPVFISSELHVLSHAGSNAYSQIPRLPEHTCAKPCQPAENASKKHSAEISTSISAISNAGADHYANCSWTERLSGGSLKVGGQLSTLAKLLFSCSYTAHCGLHQLASIPNR